MRFFRHCKKCSFFFRLDPIELGGIDSSYASDILTHRINAFEVTEGKSYLPLSKESFVHLYNILNNNIRNVLNYADNYCFWIYFEELHPETDTQKHELYLKWIDIQCIKKIDAIKIGSRALTVFNKAIALGGKFSPSDFDQFNFNSYNAMRQHIIQLENNSLIVSSIDDSDKRRKTIQVTPEGWFYNYGLLNKLPDYK